MNPKKTPMQIRVEMLATNGRGYSNVPYTKVFGEKSALRQWLRFSRVRVYNTTLNEQRGDKISLFPYLVLYSCNRIDSFFNKMKNKIPLYVMAMADRERQGRLENSLHLKE